MSSDGQFVGLGADIAAAAYQPTPAEPGGPSDAADLASAAPEDFRGATEAALVNAREAIDQLVASAPEMAAAGSMATGLLLDIFDEALAELANVAGLAGLVSKTHPNAAMRAAADVAEQEVSKILTDLSMDPAVYRSLAVLDLSDQDDVTRHYVAKTLRDFHRSGVDRDEATRERVRVLQEELVAIGQAFDRNIREDVRVAVMPPYALAGLPDDYIRAHPVEPDGYVRISTEYPDLIPFMTYATDGAARQHLWTLYRQRAYPANERVLHAMIARRHELANLLGYPSWAEYITEDKMIGSAKAAADFIAGISDASTHRARRDYEELLARKRMEDPGAVEVLPWDTAYLQDRLKAERLAFDTQQVRHYFEYGRVKAGLFELVSRMFGIDFLPRPDLPVWHPDVEAYDVVGAGDQAGRGLLGRIFLDMHPRADKYTHAAMFPMVTGKGGVRVPECALVCNLPRPGAEPALLQHNDVVTLFHEFGHLVHHVLGGHLRWSGVSGVANEWDFVEAPSQLLEEWTFDMGTLSTFAVHDETGEPLPAQTVAKLRAAREFGKGLQVRQQMFYAALSLELYRRDPATLDLVAVERETMERHTPYRFVEGTHMHLSFGHLDGYSATYYTYMWSLVIAKDLWTRFAAEGLPAPRASAAYRDAVLSRGGGAPAAELVRSFLGRDYTFQAYREWLDE